jgi:hypothetical protein
VQASIEQIPWQVAIFAEFEVEGKKVSLLCGGSIIDLSHVVTAAHCAFNPVTSQPLSAASFVVLAGASSITAQEIKEGPTVQARFVGGSRIHPGFNYAAGPGTPDDVAVLQLAEPLKASSAVKAIGLPSSTSDPPESATLIVSGFGEENPITEELNGKLYSLGMGLGFSRKCGGEADALFLCGSNTGGTACSGDSGGGVIYGSTLVGVVDIVEVVAKQRCHNGAVNGFVNLTAPEIRDFIEGSEAPPKAPRGGGVAIRGVPTLGHSLTCEPGSWSNGPTFTYAFMSSANAQVLQQGSSPTYGLSGADVGRIILCEVQATNAGGTGVARTTALAPIQPAPTLPRPIEPQPANKQLVEEFWAHPPWATVPPSVPAGGGVLGSTSANISSAQIAALLGQELAPSGKAAKHRHVAQGQRIHGHVQGARGGDGADRLVPGAAWRNTCQEDNGQAGTGGLRTRVVLGTGESKGQGQPGPPWENICSIAARASSSPPGARSPRRARHPSLPPRRSCSSSGPTAPA